MKKKKENIRQNEKVKHIEYGISFSLRNGRA